MNLSIDDAVLCRMIGETLAHDLQSKGYGGTKTLGDRVRELAVAAMRDVDLAGLVQRAVAEEAPALVRAAVREALRDKIRVAARKAVAKRADDEVARLLGRE